VKESFRSQINEKNTPRLHFGSIVCIHKYEFCQNILKKRRHFLEIIQFRVRNENTEGHSGIRLFTKWPLRGEAAHKMAAEERRGIITSGYFKVVFIGMCIAPCLRQYLENSFGVLQEIVKNSGTLYCPLKGSRMALRFSGDWRMRRDSLKRHVTPDSLQEDWKNRLFVIWARICGGIRSSD